MSSESFPYEMKSLLNRIRWLWFVALMALFGLSLATISPGMAVSVIAYDGQTQLTTVYDAPSASLIDYDAARKHTADETGNAATENRVLFAKFAKILAAKGIPPVKVLPSSGTKFVVDPKGNVIPLKPGETLTGSPNGKWLQVRDDNGNPTGMRLDGGHKPSTHPDPRAQVPHGHVPGVTNPDGTPWLPVNQ